MTPSTGGNAGTPVPVGASATSATVTGLTNGTSYTFKVTATNAIGSTDSPATSAVTPNNTLFDLAKPANVDSGDNSATEVGVNFTPSVSGNITGIRFYKAAANTGTHVVSLWTAGGQQLATANSTAANESSSGWQTVTFSQPVAVTAGTTYVAGYFAPNGHYSYNSQAFASRGDERAVDGARQQHDAQRRVRRIPGLPAEQLQRDQLLGRRAVRAGHLIGSASSGRTEPLFG